MQEISATELANVATTWRGNSQLVAVILSRLLRVPLETWPRRRQWRQTADLPLDPAIYRAPLPRGQVAQTTTDLATSLQSHLAGNRLYILTAAEQVDLDTLRLLSLFEDGPEGGTSLDLADLLTIFSSPEAHNVVNFSMDLLPSVLEAVRQSGAQTSSLDGYATIERRGSIDSVMLSELAYDEDLFERKLIDNELLYYGHEKEHTEQRTLHYIMVDSSASMRGQREVFARGLALTLSKKLLIQGGRVWIRFFDSRAYTIRDLTLPGGQSAIAHLLSFRSERGRNYSRVFAQIAGELRTLRRKQRRDVFLYLITHGQCHIDRSLARQLAQSAQVYGVFMLPSASLHLDYLDELAGYQIVEQQTFATRRASVDRALEIVEQASRRGRSHKA